MSDLPLGDPVDPSPAPRPEPVVLEGRTVTLTPLDPARDAAPLFAAAHGPEAEALWAYLSVGPFPDRSAFRSFLDSAAASIDPYFLTILAGPERRPQGYASYMRIEPAHRVIEVGNILLTPPLQRTTAATEAMYLMARHAFDGLGYRRYEWKCNALNTPSRRAALRLGFTYEGLFRQHMIIKGRNRDTAWFAMTGDEWPARKAAFEAWLEPGNFDGAGRQRRELASFRQAQPITPG